jgi:cytochrome c oxidase cbb3-type subunit IV
MDINDLRIVITTLSFVVFAGIVIWAYSGRQRARFDEAANLPFADDAELPGEVALKPKDDSTGVHS